MQANGKRSVAYLAAAILLAGVLVSATLILVPLSQSLKTVTESVTAATQTTTSKETITSTSTSVTTSTETTMSTSVTTDYIQVNDSGNSALLADCMPSQTNGYSSGTLVAGTSSPAIICVQVYWFDPTTPLVLNATSLIQIEGCEGCVTTIGGGGQSIDGAANFTIAASVDQLLLGGPTNSNEGTILAFAITAKPGASGTYQLAVQGTGSGYSSGELGNGNGLTICGPNGDLVAGNGQPNYVPPNVARLCIYEEAGTLSFNIPGIGYPIPADFLCYRIVSLTNSTQ